MVLECITSESVAVVYSKPLYLGRLIISLGRIGTTEITYTQLKAYYGSVDDFFTWEVSERTWDRQWRAIGTLSVYTSEGWKNEYWHNPGPANSPDNNLEVIQGLDGTWSTQTSDLDGLNGAPPLSPWVRVNSLLYYNQALETGQPVAPPSATTAYWDLNRVYSGASYAQGVAITHVFRMPNSRWNLKVYKNNLEIDNIILQGDPKDPFNPPPLISAPCPATSMLPWTDNFTKLPNTQAIEVTIPPDYPHRKLIWLVNLNAAGVETSREVLLYLNNCIGQPPIQHSLFCGYTGQCPPNTCEVDCGTYVCCYDSSGIATSSFYK